jgi:hypothetical protein
VEITKKLTEQRINRIASCEITMVKSTKTQRIREKMRADIKHSKQTTLGTLPEIYKAEPAKTAVPERKKQIEITEISTDTREDELIIKIGFRLLPSRTAFSRLTSNLYFDEEKIDSLRLRILQGPLATDSSEFSSVLDMTGIGKGQHTIRVEMYELWSSEEKLTSTSKEATIEYVPIRREDRLVKVPTVKSSAGADLSIISASEKNIYREIEKEMKRESDSRRDYW